MAKKGRADSIILPMDQEDTSGGGGRKHYKEANYHMKIVGIKPGNSKDKNTPYMGVILQFVNGKYKKQKFEERLYLTPKSLPRVRALFAAVGIKLPKKKVRIPFSKVVGKELGVSIEDDFYEDNKGKERKASTVAFDGFMSLEELADEDSDDEDSDDEDLDEDEDEDEDDDDDDDEDIEEMDLDDDI